MTLPPDRTSLFLDPAFGKALADTAVEAIVVLDPHGRIVDLNPAAEKLFRCRRSEVLEKGFGDLFVPKSHLDNHRKALRRYRETRKPHILGQRLEVPVVLPSGEIRVELTVTAVEVEKRLLFVGYLRDIGAQTAAALSLEDARRAAEESSAAKSRFLANMSHEIRTPLAALVGYADLLERRPEDPLWRDWVARLRRNADHLLALLNDILDLSKIEAGEMSLEMANVNLFQLLYSLKEVMEPLAVERGLEFSIETSGEVPGILLTDQLRLRQILLNLVSNGLKFTDAGGVAVNATYDAEEEHLHFQVRDTGEGIPADRLQTVFEPFYQLDSGSRRKTGTGLGLDISSQLARALGGSLAVESQEGVGTTFTLSLPVAAGSTLVDTDRYSIAEFAPDPDLIAPDLNEIRILVADDNESNRHLLETFLKETGAIVTTAGDGGEAVRLASSTAFDLILIDMQMPRVDGYEGTRLLRAQGYSGPIVAVTAHAMTGDRTACISAGCDDYLTKPILPETLFTCLERALRRHWTRRIQRSRGDSPRPKPSSSVDDRLRELAERYREDLPRVAALIREAHSKGDSATIRSEAHKLAGTGTSYGFSRISELASACEVAIRCGTPLGELGAALSDLDDEIRQVAGS
jgi:PAS domain S-box-containing protein